MGLSLVRGLLLLALICGMTDLRILISDKGKAYSTSSWLTYQGSLPGYPQCCAQTQGCQMLRLSAGVVEAVASSEAARVSFGSALAFKDMQVVLAYDPALKSLTGHAYMDGQEYFISPTSLKERSKAPCFVQTQASSLNLFHKLILRGPSEGLSPALLSPQTVAPAPECCQDFDSCEKTALDTSLLSLRKPEVTIPLPWRAPLLYSDNLETFKLSYSRPHSCLGFCATYEYVGSLGLSAKVIYPGAANQPELLIIRGNTIYSAHFCEAEGSYVMTSKKKASSLQLPPEEDIAELLQDNKEDGSAAMRTEKLEDEQRLLPLPYEGLLADDLTNIMRTTALGCEYTHSYCNFNYYVIDSHVMDNPNNKTDECRQSCQNNADCKHFTWFEARGETRCYLLSQCHPVQENDAECLQADPKKCESGPRECLANVTEVVTGCDPPTNLNPDFIQWQCNDVEGNVMSAQELNETVRVGTKCYLRCDSWLSQSGQQGYLESECSGDGLWSQTQPHNGEASLDFPPPPYPLPTADETTDVKPLSCECDALPLIAEGTDLYYNPNDEVGADFLCTSGLDNSNQTWSIQKDNECTLWCDNHLVAEARCNNGLWTGQPTKEFWCYEKPIVSLTDWTEWSVCSDNTRTRTRECEGRLCDSLDTTEQQACGSSEVTAINTLVVTGGSGDNGALSDVEAIAFPTDKKACEVNDLPQTKNNHVTFLEIGVQRLTVCGGYGSNANGGYEDSCLGYVNNTWEYMTANLTTRYRAFSSYATIGNQSCIMGGYSTANATVECYDSTAETWSQLETVPVGDGIYASCVIDMDDKIIITGGFYGAKKQIVERHSNGTYEIWSTQELPTGNFGHGCVNIDANKILLAGGYDSVSYIASNQVVLLDVQARSVSTNTNSMAEKRQIFHLALINGFIYAVGGYVNENDSIYHTIIEEAPSNTTDPVWTNSSLALQTGRNNFGMALVPSTTIGC